MSFTFPAVVFAVLRHDLVSVLLGNSSIPRSSPLVRQKSDDGQMDPTSNQEDVVGWEPESARVLRSERREVETGEPE